MKIPQEYDLVEKPFYAQLKTIGWQWIKGDADVPKLTDLLTGHVRVPERIAVAS